MEKEAFEFYDEGKYSVFNKFKELLKAINTLDGLLKGINIDGIINDDELAELSNWCVLQRPFIDKHPFKEIVPLVESYLDDGVLSKEEYDDIRWLCDKYLSMTEDQRDIQMMMQTLHGILHGILADNVITLDEATKLKQWLAQNDFLQGLYPFDELYSMLSEFLKDNVLDEDEKKALKAFISEFIDTKKSVNVSELELNELKEQYFVDGICAMCPDIVFDNHAFCFTGKSTNFTRSDIAEKITSLNGVFKNGVSSKVHYLIVGNFGNPCWVYSCYGRKIEAAVKLRKQGVKILIVHENDFNDALLDCC